MTIAQEIRDVCLSCQDRVETIRERVIELQAAETMAKSELTQKQEALQAEMSDCERLKQMLREKEQLVIKLTETCESTKRRILDLSQERESSVSAVHAAYTS
jgi:hypothetical protein